MLYCIIDVFNMSVAFQLKEKVLNILRRRFARKHQKYIDSQQLMNAIIDCDIQKAMSLMDGRVKWNFRDAETRDTFLLALCKNVSIYNQDEWLEFLRHLLEKGSFLDKKDMYGNTAFDYSITRGLWKFYRELEITAFENLLQRLWFIY